MLDQKTKEPSMVDTDMIRKYFHRSAGLLIKSKIKTTLTILTIVFLKTTRPKSARPWKNQEMSNWAAIKYGSISRK